MVVYSTPGSWSRVPSLGVVGSKSCAFWGVVYRCIVAAIVKMFIYVCVVHVDY